MSEPCAFLQVPSDSGDLKVAWVLESPMNRDLTIPQSRFMWPKIASTRPLVTPISDVAGAVFD
ncbi:MAG: hypothetical protein JKX71_11290 [Amylibacter sp.]|nr:hypothetical protein [Amylibacter sp.]